MPCARGTQWNPSLVGQVLRQNKPAIVDTYSLSLDGVNHAASFHRLLFVRLDSVPADCPCF